MNINTWTQVFIFIWLNPVQRFFIFSIFDPVVIVMRVDRLYASNSVVTRTSSRYYRVTENCNTSTMRPFKIFSRWRYLLFSISQFNSRNPNPKLNPASLRARIGNYATQHGTLARQHHTHHFEQEPKRKLPESTIRKCKTDKSVTAKMQY